MTDEPGFKAETCYTTEYPPVQIMGYQRPQEWQVDLVNEGKLIEERVLRYFERLRNNDVLSASSESQRAVAIAKTEVQGAFMWANRAVFNPGRIKLASDEV